MKVISLFCGAGGMDYGFLKAGHTIVWANDHDKDSLETYRNNICTKFNLPEDHIVLGDIEKIDTKDIPDGDIVIGGFPCQGFSIANLYRHVGDERNKLYLELLRVIKEKKPKYFVAENVPGLLSIGKGEVIKLIMKDFKEAGYKAQYKVLNAVDFGVPQSRRRVIILGTRNDIPKRAVHPQPTHFENSSINIAGKKNNSWKTVKDAISDLPEEPTDKIPNHQGTKHKVKINGHMGNRATKWDKPSPTIVGRGGGTGGPVIIPHPNLKRRMTVRETARLQSFPDDFVFYGAVTSQFRQIGNAVPWPLAYHVAKEIPIRLKD
ncbi:MAG: DNA cytosine methyltransferase [Nanoarchaeota archaeon]|nr:DNA cytosine methyltransferase [Nanoarchaeota archaeon]MBU1622135.1 DNA cytosine methyltransferase [Nanoarchaeota archaeon]